MISFLLQTEKAYQKQDAVFLGRKRVLGRKGAKGLRYYKSIGLGFKTPKSAIEGSYVDKKCPFTGNVSIRGRILKAMVIYNTYTQHMNHTITNIHTNTPYTISIRINTYVLIYPCSVTISTSILISIHYTPSTTHHPNLAHSNTRTPN
ncbi:hypothetical protein EON63_18070 [archaeon]|nr:MAG: hypothetical protein EON63_18070 [archaeon]